MRQLTTKVTVMQLFLKLTDSQMFLKKSDHSLNWLLLQTLEVQNNLFLKILVTVISRNRNFQNIMY